MRLSDFRRAVQQVRRTTSPQRPDDFVRAAFLVDRTNARYVSLARVVETPRGWRTITVTKVPGERARRHVQLFYPPEGYRGTFRACRGLRVDCDCGRHVFVWNYALNEQGLAVRDRTNGEPSDVTNPEERLGTCKHGVIALRYLGRENPVFPHGGTGRGGRDDAVPLTTLRQARSRR